MNVAMPVDPLLCAAAAQRAASNPLVSTFVAASAGSGKTKLLTDRLLRLMLAGADPTRIVCLTFTRAGAAEMALRLRARLGAWVVTPEAKLRADLLAFEVESTPEATRRARALFATILDLPGGLRIGTIHAFCQSLLGRFPLEAGLSPRFGLLEDTDARIALSDALEGVLARDPPGAMREAVERLSAQKTLGDVRRLVDDLQLDRPRLAAGVALSPDLVRFRQAAVLGAEDAAAVMARAVRVPDAAVAATQAVARLGGPKPSGIATTRCDWLARTPDMRAASWGDYVATWLTKDGEPFKEPSLFDTKFQKLHSNHADACLTEQRRVVKVQDAIGAAEMLELSSALARLAFPTVESFAQRKAAIAKLDYGDMIERTVRLLREQPGAAWVLHKLDGGIDHLLLDEVQDTAPAQWEIAAKLTEEFFSGEGARDDLPVPRSFFAVGDRKQSIFSFQGADPAGFDHWHDEYRRRVTDAGTGWAEVTLNVSFRSTAPVLALVDAVFAGSDISDTAVSHLSSRPGQAGSVELWPVEPRPENLAVEPYRVPRQRQRGKNATQVLVDTLADWIAAETDGSRILESHGRPLTPGDVLVLVRGRGTIPRPLIRALKQRRVPVAGLDQMILTEQPAVVDLLTLCDALLLPGDDLAVGCVLTGPLGDLTDDELMALAMDRPPGTTLWETLRARTDERPCFARAWTMLEALFQRVDFVTPHALLTEILGAHGGQARLLRRLGAEAMDPIGELLAASLTHAAAHPPSLQGFVHWLRRTAATVKRESDSSGGMVRIMTVHGAKGLQAPLVILPDTTFKPKGAHRLLWANGVPLWSPGKHATCQEFEELHAAENARALQEERRLLYVALTRAEDRLVVCGKQHGTKPEPAPDSWYAMVAAGMNRLGDGASCPQTVAPDRPTMARAASTNVGMPAWSGAAPAWTCTPPPAEPALPARLVPSRPEGASYGIVPASVSPLTAPAPDLRYARGRLVHSLLQHLPDLPPDAREPAARKLLARPAHGIDAEVQEKLWREVTAVMAHPSLRAAFAPGSRAEVPLSGLVGGVVIGGVVDRLAVTPERVLIVDYKTNREPPAAVAGVPVAYLRQMAAYRALLAAIYPDRPVECALVWTATATVMELPSALLEAHGPALDPALDPGRAPAHN